MVYYCRDSLWIKIYIAANAVWWLSFPLLCYGRAVGWGKGSENPRVGAQLLNSSAKWSETVWQSSLERMKAHLCPNTGCVYCFERCFLFILRVQTCKLLDFKYILILVFVSCISHRKWGHSCGVFLILHCLLFPQWRSACEACTVLALTVVPSCPCALSHWVEGCGRQLGISNLPLNWRLLDHHWFQVWRAFFLSLSARDKSTLVLQ